MVLPPPRLERRGLSNTTHTTPLDSSKRGRKISLSFDQVFDQREEEAPDHALQQPRPERFSWSDRADAKGVLNTSHLTETPISTSMLPTTPHRPTTRIPITRKQDDPTHISTPLSNTKMTELKKMASMPSLRSASSLKRRLSINVNVRQWPSKAKDWFMEGYRSSSDFDKRLGSMVRTPLSPFPSQLLVYP